MRNVSAAYFYKNNYKSVIFVQNPLISGNDDYAKSALFTKSLQLFPRLKILHQPISLIEPATKMQNLD